MDGAVPDRSDKRNNQMIKQIEIRNLKHFASMSKETYCFTGTLFVDGKKRGVVSNQGYGGCNEFTDTDVQLEINAYAKSLPFVKTSFGEFEQSVDSLITDIVHWQIIRKELQRNLKNKVMYIENGKLMQTNNARSPAMLSKWIEEVKSEKIDGVRTILNLFSVDDAVELYRVAKRLAA